ncbi:MAG: serine/threonine protein kinase [Lachnospiraceae bacterium]|nr:serine/threonine protein kinase [Lachnospiraceae bacterium]
MLEIGSVVDGKYKILSKIGQGGMSTVYLALNERANKSWAVKEVRKDGGADFEVIKQSQIVETNLLKKLNHPNLPSIIDVIDKEDCFLIVMDYIEGNPLSDAIKVKKRMNCEDVIEWAKQLCDVLEYLHTRKPPIIYRDMKPANVMLKPDGSVMLIDFGIAREFKEQKVEDTTWLGTRGYAAPEQFGGQGQTDARTDVYCLGATIYHLITGHNPSDPPYEMYPIRYWDSSFSSGLEKIIIKCTQRNPEDRYQSCAELLYALEHYEEEEEGYKKVQNAKWYSFLAVVASTVVTAICTIFCYVGLTAVATDKYKEYLNNASMARDLNDKYEYYKDAIELNPSEEEAYIDIIETMQSDGVFDDYESERIREIIPAHIDDLEKNKETYVQLAYELGMMYFYYSEQGQDTQNALKWLNIAVGNQAENISEEDVNGILGSKKAVRAKNLFHIAQYYQSLGVLNKEGDYEGDYYNLWNDLSSVMTPDLREEDNNVTALVMYNFMVSQIQQNAQHFRDAGVEQNEMENMLDMIQNNTQYNMNNSYEIELYEKLKSNMEYAKKALSVTTGTEEREYGY